MVHPSSQSVVLVTEKTDYHADDVVRAMKKLGSEPIRVNADNIPQQTEITLFHNRSLWNGGFVIKTNGRIVDINNIKSIWWRHAETYTFSEQLSEQEREFAKGELNHLLYGLWECVDAYWISHPRCIRNASWKLEQLKRATTLGLSVPKTLISSNPDEVRVFYESCQGKMIFKVMTDIFLGSYKQPRINEQGRLEVQGVHTTLITEELLENISSVMYLPCLFQEYIPKLFEYRVTIIGDDLFAAEIHSQAHMNTSIDWRHYDIQIPYRKGEMPISIQEKCMNLTKAYGLNFNTIDMIFTPEGEFVFLENNPNGQFIFIERMIPEFRMTEALASCLIRGSNASV